MRSKRTSSIGNAFLTILAMLFILAALCVLAAAGFIFMNPSVLPASMQPLPPIPEVPTLAPLPTKTPTEKPLLPPTWTPAPTNTSVPTNTPFPTNTPLPTSTPFSLLPSATTPPQITGTPPKFAYVLQGTPIALKNFTRPELECGWMGVGGQVFDLNNAPITQLEVALGGSLAGVPLDFLTLTGLATQYGPGGYEFTLANGPVASKNTLYIQLLDQSGLPLSDKIFFETYADCDRALLLINFKQVK